MLSPDYQRQQRLLRRLARPLLLCLAFSVGPALADDASDYEKQLKELQSNIQKLQKELKEVKSSRDELQDELEESESDIGELLKKIEKLKSEMEQQDEQLQSLHKERSELQQARREQQAAVAEQVQAAYRLGRQSQIKLLLNQEAPERVTRILTYYDYLLAARSDKLTSYLNTLNRLDAIEPEIEAKTAALARDKDALSQRHRELAERQEKRKQTLAKLNSSISSSDQRLAKMQRDRERLEKLLGEMTSTIASIPLPGDGQAFSRSKGKLPWPTKGRVQHRFGSSQVADKLQWNGLLIQAPAGEPVVAVHYGRVVFSDYFRGHGLLVIVDHGEGFMSLYAHNQSLLKETGEWVSAGEHIARVGSTGGRESPGLYFEIRQGGRPTDPAQWLARA